MNVGDSIRYLNSEDTKKMTSQTMTNVLGSVVSEAGYVSTGDELQLKDMINQFLKKSEESTERFDQNQWESTFWSEEWLRPDKMTNFLNENYAKEYKKHYDKSTKNTEKKQAVVAGIDVNAIGIFKAKAKVSHKSKTSSDNEIEKMDKNIKENDLKLNWNGEKFEIRPMKLNRVNLNDFESTETIASQSVQLKAFQAIYSVQLNMNHHEIRFFETQEETEANCKNKLDILNKRLNDVNRVQRKQLEDRKKKYEEANKKLIFFAKKVNDLSQLVAKLGKKNEKFDSIQKTSLKKTSGQKKWPGNKYCVGFEPDAQSFTREDKQGEKIVNVDIPSEMNDCPKGLKYRSANVFQHFKHKKAYADTYAEGTNSFINHFQSNGKRSFQMMFRVCCK